MLGSGLRRCLGHERREGEVVPGGKQGEEDSPAAFIGNERERGGIAGFQLKAHSWHGQFALVDHRDLDLQACLRRAGPHYRTERQ